MSGPIVRKYGFPNFEKIFGEREIKHGVEDEAPAKGTGVTPSGLPEPGPTPDATGSGPEPRSDPRPSKG